MEIYTDGAIGSEQAFGKIQQSFSEKSLHEVEDLQEIQNKMLEQKNNLSKKNIDGRYDEILDQLSRNIEEIGKIISNEKRTLSTQKNLLKSNENRKYYQMQMLLNTDPTSPSPYRGKTEMENINTYTPNNDLNITPNISNGDTLLPRETFDTINSNNPSDISTNPIDQERERVTRKRNSPLQSNFISNIIAKFNLNKKRSNINSIPNENKMKFHNISILHHSCGRYPSEVGCQVDLMRLLFLFLATRPYSRHRDFICSLATSQFEVTLQLYQSN